MPEQISWTLNVQVVGGPKISASRTVEVEAYDKIKVIIPRKEAAAGSATVDVQPGGAGRVQFLILSAEPEREGLTFRVNEAADVFPFDGTIFLSGEGAVGLLPDVPKKLHFANDHTEPVTVTILAGRKATS